MRTRGEVEHQFTYQQPTADEQKKLGELGTRFREMALFIFDTLPESADRTVALRKLAEARMATNAALVLNRSVVPPTSESR